MIHAAAQGWTFTAWPALALFAGLAVVAALLAVLIHEVRIAPVLDDDQLPVRDEAQVIPFPGRRLRVISGALDQAGDTAHRVDWPWAPTQDDAA